MASATILQTERIDLRELTPDDAHAVFELNADPEVLRFTGDVAFASLDDARRFLETYSDYRRNGFGRWAAVLRESGAFLGWCGLKRDASGEVDVGYRLLRAHWGRGYATEAARACVRHGFDVHALECIVGRAAEDNSASLRVLAKCGLSYWKRVELEGLGSALVYRALRGNSLATRDAQ